MGVTNAGPPARTTSRCLDEGELFELSRGALGDDALAEAEEHLDECAGCRRVLAAVVRREPREVRPPLVFDPRLVERR